MAHYVMHKIITFRIPNSIFETSNIAWHGQHPVSTSGLGTAGILQWRDPLPVPYADLFILSVPTFSPPIFYE